MVAATKMIQTPVPLAIVGIGCQLPGDSTNPEKLWDLLSNGKSAWSKVPADRYNEEAFLHPDPDDGNGTHNHSGGHFLKRDMAEFDAGFFNLLPQEASAMDPQQRLLLETAYEALESAGIPQEKIRKTNTAVYMAMFTRDYDRNVYKDMMDIPKYHVTGTGEAILANRLSHLFDLNGPSMTIDTGCSGGMAAVSQACQSLRSGDCDLALAGGANLILSPDHMISMSNLHMLNADGRSYSFDERGAGYGRGEGIAVLAIKRLDDAIKSNDPIRAVILDAALNQDGHTTGITLPSGSAQMALESKVWARVGLNPKDVAYVEAHGTGTLAGDGAELEGISKVFCQDRDTPLYVGSIKSNIGHLECVSGLAALIKATLMLEHEAIPPNVNLNQERASLDISSKNITIPKALVPWKFDGVPRISINSFGYGGTNAHVILERYMQSTKEPSGEKSPSGQIPRLFLLSAASQTSLSKIISNTKEWLSQQQEGELSLRSLSYTLCQRRSIMPWRFSCVATSKQELLDALDKGIKTTDSMKRIPTDVSLSFVFTGQGAQWARMGKELLSDTVFRDSMYRSRDILQDIGSSWDLIEELIRDDKSSRLKEAELAQPSTAAIQIALIDLLRSWGVIPSSVVGHSSGEIGAAYAAGYLSQYTALKAAYYRGFSAGISKSKGLGKGGMIAVGLGEEDVSKYISRLTKGVAVIACQNSPSSTTVSGDDTAIEEISQILTADGVFNRRLNVDAAYHSHHMQAAAEEYKNSLGNIEVDSPLPIKFFSSVTGIEKSGGFDADYWTSNLVSKVRFCDALQALVQSGHSSNRNAQPHRIFIEIGPHSALAGPARQSITGLDDQVPFDYTSALVRGKGAIQSVLEMIASIFNRGYVADLSSVIKLDRDSHNASVLYSLPSYAWDHSKKHWHESRLSRDYRLRKHPYHDLLGTRMTDNTPLRPSWRHLVGVEGLPWLKDHVVDGLIIFPGSGYLCMAIEAASQLAQDNYPQKQIRRFLLKDISFLKGLVIPEGRTRVEMQISLTPVKNSETAKETEYDFSVTAFAEDEHWSENCHGSVVVEFFSDAGQNPFEISLNYEELSEGLNQATTKVVSSDDLYSELERVGNKYGPSFSSIVHFSMDGDQTLSHVSIPDIAEVMPAQYMRPHVIHPTTLDTLLHTSLPLVNHKLGSGSVMPVHIQEVAISSDIESRAGEYLSAVTTLTSSRFRAAEADILVFPGKGVRDATPVMSVSTMELRSLASSSTDIEGDQDGRDICYELKWNIDERFLSEKHIQSLEPPLSWEQKFKILDQATGIYISRCISQIRDKHLKIPENYHKILYEWMEKTEPPTHTTRDLVSEEKILKLAFEQGVEGEFLTRLGPALPGILTGQVNALQLMLEDDLLYRVYADDSSARCYDLMSEYLKFKSFKQADISVLEIGGGTGGATLPFLEALSSQGICPTVYDFTDVSAGFFDRARNKLQEWTDTVNFRPLDIEKEPTSQGFEAHSYDIVLACNVLHATPSIKATLSKVRSMLKPDGVLLLIEVTNPQRYLNITFGTLPGWWKGAEEGRNTGPFLSSDAWSNAMSQVSLEMQLVAKDDSQLPLSSLMVSRATDDITSAIRPEIRLILEPHLPQELDDFVGIFSTTLQNNGLSTSISSWKDQPLHENILNIVIDNGASPVLSRATEYEFQRIRDLLRRPSNVFWITLQDKEEDRFNPKKHLITGLSRTAHAENEDLQLISIDIQETLREVNQPDMLDVLMRIIKFSLMKTRSAEREYVLNRTGLLVPRVIPSIPLNQQVSSNNESTTVTRTISTSQEVVRLDTQTKDFLNDPVFIEDEAHRVPLDKDMVEITLKAYGVPSGGLQSRIHEYAGLVTAIGSDVSGLRIGDRVVAFGTTCYPSRPRVHMSQVQLLPDSISFSAAATLPISFMASTHALIRLADVRPGQTVLIDGAMTDVGRAVLTIAQFLGVKVIAAVSREDEAQLLTDTFKVSSNAVIPRTGHVAKRQLHKLIGTTGLDVIINCSRSKTSSDISAYLNPFSSVINIQSHANEINIPANDRSNYPANTLVTSFDLETLYQFKPLEVAKLLEQVITMIRNGMALEPWGVATVSITDIEKLKSAYRDESNKKVVLTVDNDSLIKVAKPSHTILQLDPDATYVVAGGLGDLGKRYLRLMAKAGAKTLVTLSRNGHDSPEHFRFQEELRNMGVESTLHSLKCNIADKSSTISALDEIKRRNLPPVRGVVQAAVVLRDSTLDTMTVETFNSVLESKMVGTLNLQKVFSPENLHFFISLSSAVGIIGTSGQANYNAGNTLQDAIAQWQKDSSCHYMSINIGTIEGADATINNQSRMQALRRQGLTPIMPDELLSFFEYSMSVDAREAGCHQAIIGFTSESLAETTAANGAVHTPMFTHVRHARKTDAKSDVAVQRKTFKDIITETKNPNEISLFIAQSIAAKLASLISVDVSDIDLGSSIIDSGIDSLIAIELRNWVMREFDSPIQSSEVLDGADIVSLAQKVALRSRLLADDSTEADTNSSVGIPISTLPTSRSRSIESQRKTLETLLAPLPVPDLTDTLRKFVDSRKAMASPEELEEVALAVEEFKASGSALQKKLQENPFGNEKRLQFYDNYIHLDRREALQDHALFYLGHLTDGAPVHTQAERAAIITISALSFKKQLQNGTLEQNSLNGVPLCTETLQWIFHTVQVPTEGGDKVRKYPPSNNIVVMRRGHFFQVTVQEQDGVAELAALFNQLIALSEQPVPPVSVLTSKERDDWAALRLQLMASTSNVPTIEAIESAAFIVCLDDTAPVTASERCTSILVNDRHFTNRWLDKMLEFTVAANGVSALVGENSKLDGLSVKQLHEMITDEIMDYRTPTPPVEKLEISSRVREIKFEIPSVILDTIQTQTTTNLSHYKTIGAYRENYAALNRSFLGKHQLRSKGTVLIAILFATRLFYGYFQPVWETITVAKFSKGRIDWLQSLTPDIALWIESAIQYMNDRTKRNDALKLATSLRDAVNGHTQALREVADGRGYVEHLYSLLGVAMTESQQEGKALELPPLFKSTSWTFADRHATPKMAKTDCLGSGGWLRMQEGGFLMPNPNSVFVHYEVHHLDPLILVQGHEDDVSRFEKCLKQAVDTMRSIIEAES
ncbi:Compactin diketide synthase mokB [Talaromyces pinophilus]|nr:Compactin diketide synthase mokB [Talaromyces pinophilus]